MANVTEEVGVYDNAGTPQELHCRAFVTFDNVTGAVARFESWENTYPFAWRLRAERADGAVFENVIAANSQRTQRLNVPAGYNYFTTNWQLTRA